MSEQPSFRFSRSARLHYGHEFAQVKSQGQRLTAGCLLLNWNDRPGQPHSRLGVITSKKIGNAVTRSRARRLIRETFRLNQHKLHRSIDLVVIARNSITSKNRPGVEKDFLGGLHRARLLKGIL